MPVTERKGPSPFAGGLVVFGMKPPPNSRIGLPKPKPPGGEEPDQGSTGAEPPPNSSAPPAAAEATPNSGTAPTPFIRSPFIRMARPEEYGGGFVKGGQRAPPPTKAPEKADE